MELKCKFIKKRIHYTGRELSSHWIYKNFNLEGDALVAFIGRADVKEHLVDMADRKKNSEIRSPAMLHFIAEYFDMDLEKTILRQRLFMRLLADEINRADRRYAVESRGDDLYAGDRKLSVAIATLTPVSSVFHVGLNIKSSGAPVKIIGLKEFSIPPESFANDIFKLYSRELESIALSRVKVRGVA